MSNKLKPWLTESGLLRIQGWARDGLTNEDIAKNIGINPKTLYDWINKWPEIEKALRLGKEPADRKVENALFNKAVGYTYIEEVPIKTKEVLYNENGKRKSEKETIHMVEVTKHVPPETTAAIFWLKNRKPGDWRDKQEVEHSGEVDTTIKINIVPDDDD
ncbi:helix-turn-helix domain-containing protein [Erysipelothrix sp. HDW6A]|nr:helix-turn-helix domain-containing protein [Erysipelothrix sp. HDW6A]